MTSPLGGQAILRLLDHGRTSITKDTNLIYLRTSSFDNSPVNSVSGGYQLMIDVQTLYLSSLTAPLSVQNSSKDLWGNPKIPALDDLAQHTAENGQSFQKMPHKSFVNLIGVPIGNLSDDRAIQTNLTIDNTNAVFECAPVFDTMLDQFNQDMKDLVILGLSTNGTPPIHFESFVLSGHSYSFLVRSKESWTAFEKNTSTPIIVYYGVGLPDSPRNVAVTQCSMEMVRLNAEVSCMGKDCEVGTVRRRRSNLSLEYILNLGGFFSRGTFCGLGLSARLQARSKTHSFLLDPQAVVGNDFQTDIVLGNIPLRELEYRLTLAYNTFLSAASFFTYSQPLSTISRTLSMENLLPYTEAVETTILGEVYRCRWSWFVVGLVVTILLELIAVVGLVLGMLTNVPDVTGYVSSMTMKNEYCQKAGASESSALDGLSKAIQLRSVKFVLKDVRPQAEVGHIAFVPVEYGNTSTDRTAVRFGRAYD